MLIPSATPAQDVQTPASCVNKTGGVAHWIGVDNMSVPMRADIPLNGHKLAGPGGAITYTGAHRRVYSTRGPATNYPCGKCGGPARQWSYIGGAVDEQVDERGRPYSGNPEMYEALCVPCHKRSDLAALGYVPSPCGTEKGYNRHRADGTPRCGPCKKAHSEYETGRRRARAARQGR